MKGRHSHNLETHIRSFHSHEAKILDQAKEDTNSVIRFKISIRDSTVQLSSKVQSCKNTINTLMDMTAIAWHHISDLLASLLYNNGMTAIAWYCTTA
ncbi:Uncharacterized protein FWK35_00030366 [Aphis craccivora]|uniref:Uncharacterized protein n=1 Tax=Aphis craccivora TaxID=307492 RepID=A0A6G0WDX8_APHCR|nr:Uncharacterized protein FWK35_00030366 [Aphis craccivora]